LSRTERTRLALAALLVGALGGCGGGGNENGPGMSPGEDCLACPNPGGSAHEAWFSAAGTVFDADGNPVVGVGVNLTDSVSRVTSDVTNFAGNFYFTEELSPPLQVTIVGAAGERTMADATGACNSCHQAGGSPGPIVLQ